MPAIFPIRAGQVAVSDEGAAANVAPLVTIEPGITFADQTCIINRLQIAQGANYQFLHTLGNKIFVYAFGDRIGRIAIGGLAFFQKCDGDGGGQTGIESMLRYYRANKLSVRQEPILITVGRETTLQGFLTDSSADIANPETNIFNFTLNMALVPEDE